MKYAYALVAGFSLTALALAPGLVAAQDAKGQTTGSTSTSTKTMTQPSGSTSTDMKSGSDMKSSTDMKSGTDASGSASPSTTDQLPKDKGNSDLKSSDKATGLDRADEAAGQQGLQGRDKAREKQSR